MAIQLRDYQQDLINSCIKSLKKGNKKVLLYLPTGGGKTACASYLVKRSADKGKSSIFICHRSELLAQTYKTYLKNDIKPGIIKSGVAPDYDNPMQIASINTLVRRLDKYKKPDIVFWDEAHHISSGMWLKVAQYYADAVHIGLSATPSRLDGKPLNLAFDDLVGVIDVKTLIEKGFLSPYLYYAPSNIDTSELKIAVNGDYSKESLAKASFSQNIIGDNIEQYKKLANGKRNVVFAINRKHGQDIVNRYNDAGIKAELLVGNIRQQERKKIVDLFSSGSIKVIVTVDLISEGFDLPAIEVVSLLRPTASTSLYLQQIGRALRICPEIGKTHAIILDHVNNYKRHGMPDDSREWSLEGGLKQKKKREKQEVPIKRCPICFFAHAPALKCPNCGHVYTANRKDIKEISGDLVLLGSPEYYEAQKKEIIVAHSLDDLVRIEKERDYKKYWAEKQWQLKTGENLWKTLDGLEKISQARGYKGSWAWVRWNKMRGF